MQAESQCRFCAKLPVIHHVGSAGTRRCPLCKGQLVEDRESGTTYRFEETTPGSAPPRSLGRRLAALLGIGAGVVLIWLLIKPQVPEQALATVAKPGNQPVLLSDPKRILPAEPSIGGPPTQHEGHGQAKPGTGNVHLPMARPSAVAHETASKPYSFRGVAKNRAPDAEAIDCVVKPPRAEPAGAVVKDQQFPPLPSFYHAYSEPELLAKLQQLSPIEARYHSKEARPKDQSTQGHAQYLKELTAANPHLAGLPFLLDGCELAAADAVKFEQQCRTWRNAFSKAVAQEQEKTRQRQHYRWYYGDTSADAKEEVRRNLVEFAFVWKTLIQKTASGSQFDIAPLQQLLMDRSPAGRYALVFALSSNHDQESTRALAKRALFDLDGDVRWAATMALRERSADDYRPILLHGLRYPWPEVAWHAAQALALLKPTEVVPHLLTQLENSDPDAPFADQGKTKIRELVRINHNKNCMMCHAVSNAGTDKVRGAVPLANLPLPEPFSRQYYAERSPNDGFVRADVTYLRQDFSAELEVANPGPWPKLQRHDFLVRVRELSKEEAANWQNRQGPEHSEYKQAALYALRNLTGIDAGENAAAWRDRLGLPLAAPKSARH